jgi:hypothetical protein
VSFPWCFRLGDDDIDDEHEDDSEDDDDATMSDKLKTNLTQLLSSTNNNHTLTSVLDLVGLLSTSSGLVLIIQLTSSASLSSISSTGFGVRLLPLSIVLGRILERRYGIGNYEANDTQDVESYPKEETSTSTASSPTFTATTSSSTTKPTDLVQSIRTAFQGPKAEYFEAALEVGPCLGVCLGLADGSGGLLGLAGWVSRPWEVWRCGE